MKKLIYIIIIFLILGCSNNNSAVKLLKVSVKSYQNIKNTKEVTTKSALVYVKFNHKSSSFIVSIGSRDRENSIGLSRCLVNKQVSQILPTNQKAIEGIEWLDSYKVTTPKAKKRLKLECILTNQDSFITTFEL